jgi:hypothetical protein
VNSGAPPETFLSGRVGYVGPRRSVPARAGDRLLDGLAALRRVPRRLDRMAAAVPARRVLVLCVYRPDSTRAQLLPAALHSERHQLQLAFGSRGAPAAELAPVTGAHDLGAGKFQNLNALLDAERIDPADFDWTLVVDDDVLLPPDFTARLLGVCESLDLALAQPAQTLASHAAWSVTRRRPFALARRTRFVEIGPLFAMRREVAAELVPFPDLRFGWGLELHWSALAREHGWSLGVVDALPVRHDLAGVASDYRHREAVEEASRFLAERPYVVAREANRTLAVHR